MMAVSHFRINIRFVLAVVFTLASLTLLGWGLWPYGRSVRTQTIRPSDMQLPASSAGAAAGIPETRLLKLEYPTTIRVKDADVVRLTLDVEGQGGQAASVIPDAYDDYTVLAEARLDMTGMGVLPLEAVSEPMQPGKSVVFLWNVRPAAEGDYPGTVWLFLHFVPKKGGADMRVPLSAQGIEIGSNSFFGMVPGPVRWLGVVGIFISALLGLPYVAKVLGWLFTHLKR